MTAADTIRANRSPFYLIPQVLSNTLWALASLRLRAPPEWLDELLEASAPRLNAFGSQALANAVWALAKINARLRLPPAWLAAFFAASRATMSQAQPQHLANMIYGLARLGAAPPRPWLDEFFAVSATSLRRWSPQMQVGRRMGMLASLKK